MVSAIGRPTCSFRSPPVCSRPASNSLVLRPIRQADIFALITSTIFIGIGLSEVYRLVQNTEMLGVRNPVSGRPIFIGDVIITKEQIWVFGGAILSSLIGLAIFGYAPLGRGLRAMAANRPRRRALRLLD